MLTKIYHKKNELFEVEFYKDKECTDAFDFTNAENLYLELQNGDVSPFLEIYKYTEWCKCFISYIPNIEGLDFLPTFHDIFTLYDITPNLSKYIPENNAVLFLSEDDLENYQDWFHNEHIGLYINDGKNDEEFRADNIESLISGIADVKKGNITIFLTNSTEEELEKASKVAKELKEIYGVNEVNLFVLHCFKSYWHDSIFHPKNIDNLRQAFGSDFIQDTKLNGFSDIQIKDYEYLNDCRTKWEAYFCNFNKIITTNSTGILEIQNKDNLQVIDCYDIFNDYLQNKND